MDSEKITRWLTLAANVGVIAGLVLVAVQINQNTQITKAQIANDYFLAEVNDKFTNKARMAIFEVYCRIHQRINLDALATQVCSLPRHLPPS